MDRRDLSANMSLALLAIGGGGIFGAIQISDASPYRLPAFVASAIFTALGLIIWLWLFVVASKQPKLPKPEPMVLPVILDEWGRKFEAGRIFLKTYVNAAYLMKKVEGKTQLQAENDLKWYIGKWITVTGKVVDVTKLGDLTTASIMEDGAPATSIVFLVFSQDQEALFAVHKDEVITVKGKLTKVSSTSVNLSDCFLDIKVRRKPRS
jgi:hypothetical protein